MKKILSILAAALLAAPVFSQDALDAATEAAQAIAATQQQAAPEPEVSYWTNSVGFNVGFNQTGLFNWAAGGFNTLSLAAGIDAKATYSKEMTNWANRLQMDYGFLWSSDKAGLLQKSSDRIYLESKLAFKTGKESKWNYTASLDFRTQFTDTYNKYEKNTETQKWEGQELKSSFLAPAYFNLALGMEWAPTDWFNVNIAPVTGGFTFCTVDALKQQYGMKPVNPDDPKKEYRSSLFQFGAQIKANLKLSINEKFSYETQLVLFTDYLNKPFNYNRINWDNKIGWQLTKLFRLGLDTWLIYDPLVTIKDKGGVDRTSLVQFKEFLSINFTYTIANKK